tara:strand:- start:528 stop:1244 length:717 start_codon:yes stop_codon:yes gene_type:complete
MIAVIPARSGSKGVLDKNIKILDGKPLLAYSILSAKTIPLIKRVIVSTDSLKYAKIAKMYGAEVPFLRPKEISQDNSSDFDVFNHLIGWLRQNEENIPNIFVHLRPTTPLREREVLIDAINHFLENKHRATSQRSCHLAPESPFKWCFKDEKGYFKALKNGLNPENTNQPRQTFPDVYIPNGYIDLINSKNILEKSKLHGEKMLVYETPFSVEVDTEDDFQYLSYKKEKTITKKPSKA